MCEEKKSTPALRFTIDQCIKLFIFPVTLLTTIFHQYLPSAEIGLPCVFKALWGIECMGCGISHAIMAIWQGNIQESYAHHKFGLVVFIVIGSISISEIIALFNSLHIERKVNV